MSTQSDLVAALEGVKSRLTQQMMINGWSQDIIFHQQISWQGPAYTSNQIAKIIDIIIRRVTSIVPSYFEGDGVRNDYVSFINSLNAQQFAQIQSDYDAVLGSTTSLLQLLNIYIPTPAAPLPPPPKVDWEDIKNDNTLPKDLVRRLKSVDAHLRRLEPRAKAIEGKIVDIEAAHAAAEQLPTDMEELANQRDALNAIVDEAKSDVQALKDAGTSSEEHARRWLASVETTSNEAVAQRKKIEEIMSSAAKMIIRSEQALRGSTGVGLANAFEKRKNGLTVAGAFWVFGLILALMTALYIGHERVASLQNAIVASQSATVIWVNALLAILGVGAPIWFAWLSTKQIWTNFRLAEDYAFKASVSKAYEGYRKEAIELDPVLRERLFSTAMSRLEEAPIRLLDHEPHGSPLHELLSNPSIRKSLDGIPDVTNKILTLIPSKGGTAAVVAPAAVAGAALTALTTGTKPVVPEQES